jgi:transposase
MVKAAKNIKNHWDGVLNWAYQKISNGILEGFNSLFQAAKSKARGYRKFDTIRTIIYLITGKIDFSKINRYYVTHSN